MSNSTSGPALIGAQLTPALHAYLQRLIDLGLFQGANGAQQPNPSLQQLVDGFHAVLAGGSVTVQVTAPGNAQVVTELAGLVKDGTDQANAINQKVGFALTVIP